MHYTPKERISRPQPGAVDRLPPHSIEAEQGVLGCCLLDPKLIANECKHVRPDLFYDLRHQTLWSVMKEMAARRKVVDPITLPEALKKTKQLEEVGGLSYISSLPDQVPSAANLEYYLEIAREKFALRKTVQICMEAASKGMEFEGELEDFMLGLRSDIELATSLRSDCEKKETKVWTVSELAKWKAPKHLCLIGDNEICMGYEGLTLIAGPGGSGKSLCLATLVLAGAIGSGHWMGRKIHRKFKTLILQTENGPSRLQKDFVEMQRLHPDISIDEYVLITEPPDGGLPFHRPEFRVWVRGLIEKFKPDLVVIDPYAAVAAEDSAKDVVDKLTEIRSCFPGGENRPGLLIIAHTNKPRADVIRRGRGLVNLVTGSNALTNTARCVYVLFPWTDDLMDPRIYWACVKLNNGDMYPASVWNRKKGTFFEHNPDTDPSRYGIEEKQDDEERRKLEAEDIIAAFGDQTVLQKSVLARRVHEQIGVGESTVGRVITPGKLGYLSHLVEITSEGWIKLKKKEQK